MGDLEAHAFAIRGQEATVKWGYHVALRLAAWQFHGSGLSGGSVTATAVDRDRDAFRLEQSPLTLVLVSNGRPVKWPVLSLDQDGRTVSITVGPRERA